MPDHKCIVLCLILVLASCVADVTTPARQLFRSEGKRWKRVRDVAGRGAKSSVHHFLEERNQNLIVPIEIDVYLVGLHGDGGFGYALPASKIVSLLSTALGAVCPSSWESGEDLGVCFQPNYQVVGGDEAPELTSLLRQLEDGIKEAMFPTPVPPDILHAGATAPVSYTVDAARLEPLFDAFLEAVYSEEEERAAAGAAAARSAGIEVGSAPPPGKGPREWHRHNAIFVINPNKVRMDPRAHGNGNHVSPNFFEQWVTGSFDLEALAAEDGGYTYTYSYAGAGAASTWLSSRSYVVLDLAAGPTAYGPAVSRSGGVAHGSVPHIKDMLQDVLLQMASLPQHSAAQTTAAAAARAGGANLLAGPLAATLLAAGRHNFMPDVVSEHIEWAKNVLVPVILVADHDLPTSVSKGLSYQGEDSDFYGVNVTAVEHALSRLLDPDQDAVVLTAAHQLHDHRQLASALHKAMRSNARPVADVSAAQPLQAGDQAGMHTQTSTYIDPEALLEEFGLASDMLTYGLLDAGHLRDAAAGDEAHALGAARHSGTRVLPVFVLSLLHAPEDVVLATRELVAASHDVVVVLQLRQAEAWGLGGGASARAFTGHVANGERVTEDAVNVTRQVVAGLARALTGMVPPYQRYDGFDERTRFDWRWAVGATPFGPYSGYSGVSEGMAAIAQRNILLAHTHAALRSVQEGLDETDDLVARYFSGPWEAAGLSSAGRHWLGAAAEKHAGFNSTLGPADVAALEGVLVTLGEHLEVLALALFTRDWASAGEVVAARLLPTARVFTARLADALAAAEEVMRCCVLRHRHGPTEIAQMVALVAGGGAILGALLTVAACVRRARRGRGRGVGRVSLPTYGLPSYNGRPSGW